MSEARDGSRDRGVVFPEVDGTRSTTATGQAVFADAARAVDAALAQRIQTEGSWHRVYVAHVRALLEAEVRAEPSAESAAAAGLASLRRRFEFVRDGEARSLDEALAIPSGSELHGVDVPGRGDRRPDALRVPYRGRVLGGDDLHRQLDRWVEAGTVEASFAEAVRLVAANPDWLDLRDRTLVLLGAGAEMSPLEPWCRWGGTAVLVDLPGRERWTRILRAVRDGTGTAHIPITRPLGDAPADDDVAEAAGADLITSLPEVGAWLDRFEGPFTIGNYVYADGADNVRASMAVDVLIERLSSERADRSLAVLATPTDVFAVPEDAVEQSLRRYGERGPLRRATGAITGRRLFAPNYEGTVTAADGRPYGIADALVEQQGPNYVLAKRLHRWRARVARDRGVTSSINVAPPTRTHSVTKNRLLAAAYAGAPRYGVEVFEPATSRVLMAALLVHDLRNPKAVADPSVPLEHPLDLLSIGANHGGLWRIPFAPRSVLGLAAVRGMVRPGRPRS